MLFYTISHLFICHFYLINYAVFIYLIKRLELTLVVFFNFCILCYHAMANLKSIGVICQHQY